MLDLYRATRDELIRLTLAQQDVIAEQERRLTALEAQLSETQATIARLTAQLGALVATDDEAPTSPSVSRAWTRAKPRRSASASSNRPQGPPTR